ncbi:helix-turn-helix domain-containing protein [Paraburkholderia fungorum]|uniref:helix-turn-helix domain-containing protein n=1 Tax=Paraburkholderia fungorum TaxID=134537 RepID=UPI00402BB140
MNTIHSRIKHLRKERQMSMAELGAAVGVSWQTVQQWEKNTAPKRASIKQVSAALGTTEDMLIFGRERLAIASPTLSTEARMLVDAVCEADEAGVLGEVFLALSVILKNAEKGNI